MLQWRQADNMAFNLMTWCMTSDRRSVSSPLTVALNDTISYCSLEWMFSFSSEPFAINLHIGSFSFWPPVNFGPVTVTVTKALVLRPLLEDRGRITESIRILVTVDRIEEKCFQITTKRVCLFVYLSVCQTITFESFYLGSWCWQIRYISSEYGSRSYMKIIITDIKIFTNIKTANKY